MLLGPEIGGSREVDFPIQPGLHNHTALRLPEAYLRTKEDKPHKLVISSPEQFLLALGKTSVH